MGKLQQRPYAQNILYDSYDYRNKHLHINMPGNGACLEDSPKCVPATMAVKEFCLVSVKNNVWSVSEEGLEKIP